MLIRIFLICISLFKIASASVILHNDTRVVEDFPIMYFNDASAKLSIDEIAATTFTNTINSQYSLGYLKGNNWFKITIKNDEQNENEKYILSFSETLCSKFNLFRHTENGWISEKNGLDVPLKNRQIEDIRPSFTINIKAGESVTYYIQTYIELARFGEFKIYSHAEFINNTRFFISLYMLYFGGIIMIFMFNAFLYFTLKDNLYGYYSLYVFFTGVWIFTISGFIQYTILDPYSHFMHKSAPLLVIFLFLFSNSFLDIKSFMPKVYKVFLVLVASSIFFMFFTCKQCFTTVSSVTFILLMYVSFVIWRRGSLQVGYYFFGSSIFMISMILFILMVKGLVQNNDLTRYGFLFTSAIEIVLFSLIIANRFNLTQIARIKLQSDIIELKTKDTKKLERLVHERTKTLDEKNQLLSREINNKNMLLKELFHRVKNNLQIISGLLSLQSRRVKDEISKSIFSETNQRIKAIAIVHEKLYQSSDLEAINMQVYSLGLVDNLRQSFQTDELTFEIECDDFVLDLERAVPMGLIINELVTNSIKYAFDETLKNPTISVKMYVTQDDEFVLEVYDNGKGADMQSLNEGFGFKLIESLASFQLKGKIDCYNKNGLHHKITFSKELLA